MRQHHVPDAVAERQGLPQRVRRSQSAGRHLLYLAGADRRLGPASRPQRGPVEFLGVLPADGPIDVDLTTLPDREEAFTEKTSIFFKKTRIYRIPDLKRNTLIYLAISAKLIEGSPANSVSSVPIMAWPTNNEGQAYSAASASVSRPARCFSASSAAMQPSPAAVTAWR